MRSRMFGLIEGKFAATRQRDGCENSPRLLADAGSADALAFELAHRRLEVVAHQVQPMPAVVAWMNRELSRWQSEDEPAIASIDGVEAEDVAEEGAIGSRVGAVDDHMSAADETVHRRRVYSGPGGAN